MEKRIRIADHYGPMRHVIKETLLATLPTISFEEAANGREALERAEQSKPDLIILDIQMPEIDGIAAAKHLKESMPETPIILLTMWDVGRNRAREFGVDAIVAKEDGLDKLTRAAESLLAVH